MSALHCGSCTTVPSRRECVRTGFSSLTIHRECKIYDVYIFPADGDAAGEGRDWRHALHTWLTDTIRCAKCLTPMLRAIFSSRVNTPPSIYGVSNKRMSLSMRPSSAGWLRLTAKKSPSVQTWLFVIGTNLQCAVPGPKASWPIAKHFGKPVYMVTTMKHEEIPGWEYSAAHR